MSIAIIKQGYRQVLPRQIDRAFPSEQTEGDLGVEGNADRHRVIHPTHQLYPGLLNLSVQNVGGLDLNQVNLVAFHARSKRG